MHWGCCAPCRRLCGPRSPNPLPAGSCRMLPRAPANSYHGEAHIGLLERGPIIGAIPRHGHHLPLLRVCAVDDACGWGEHVLRALGLPAGRGQPPLWPLPCHPLPSSFFPAPAGDVAPLSPEPAAALCGPGLSPLQHPLCFLQPVATVAAILAGRASPLPIPQGPFCPPGAPGFGRGAYYLLPQHLLPGGGAGGVSHTRGGLGSAVCQCLLSRRSSSVKSSANNRANR